jgi:hypothetical protein
MIDSVLVERRLSEQRIHFDLVGEDLGVEYYQYILDQRRCEVTQINPLNRTDRPEPLEGR